MCTLAHLFPAPSSHLLPKKMFRWVSRRPRVLILSIHGGSWWAWRLSSSKREQRGLLAGQAKLMLVGSSKRPCLHKYNSGRPRHQPHTSTCPHTYVHGHTHTNHAYMTQSLEVLKKVCIYHHRQPFASEYHDGAIACLTVCPGPWGMVTRHSTFTSEASTRTHFV